MRDRAIREVEDVESALRADGHASAGHLDQTVAAVGCQAVLPGGALDRQLACRSCWIVDPRNPADRRHPQPSGRVDLQVLHHAGGQTGGDMLEAAAGYSHQATEVQAEPDVSCAVLGECGGCLADSFRGSEGYEALALAFEAREGSVAEGGHPDGVARVLPDPKDVLTIEAVAHVVDRHGIELVELFDAMHRRKTNDAVAGRKPERAVAVAEDDLIPPPSREVLRGGPE